MEILSTLSKHRGIQHFSLFYTGNIWNATLPTIYIIMTFKNNFQLLTLDADFEIYMKSMDKKIKHYKLHFDGYSTHTLKILDRIRPQIEGYDRGSL